MQRREERGLRAQVAGVTQQLHQRLAHRAEQELRHRRAVPAPQRIQLMRDRENQMMVSAPEQPRLLALEPLLGRQCLALRTDALVTRVLERTLDVSLGAAAQVSAELGRAAARDPVRRPVHVRRQPVAHRVRFKVRLKDSCERAFHPPYNARSSLAYTPPAQPGSCNV